ncbi:putative bifunctional inhibitor/plant lipid transfer protein/seed storage helical [Helianthus annuus]|uniref:Bifunctional inhibitor/plant lipid transfer protein/seed storage helical n=1 Tax=Helianthus annuus TaxID=4232 RepID=A0A9K3DT66_HELAN|nr:putative lipid-binding protein At4g00165 [Helianthus annuus]KAF5761011.1 putative bifunctional inhibitor/plant lipid transfer protein/seed storage helical [Helianthus annuus]KAJ0438952.1 putative bifunctional inhibitor/plant lipid transfer protein/seed storage helical [Helianthus annuus]KAJ0443901.1 putative bifunctional inhibitor/plant lipid transfer protein/seed storage helical [Helianthus annuus]KAJ0461305.1 putative bifunctional inhibitor/plant lipid transfer protein/seed storage helical
MNPSKVSILFILANVILFTIVSANKHPCPPKTPTTKCPKDTLKFGVCGDWLGLVHEAIGAQPDSECCSLVKGLADLEAAACLCTALKANVLGVLKVKAPVALSLLVNSCGKKVPEGFKCA